jgi:hypothetical protein
MHRLTLRKFSRSRRQAQGSGQTREKLDGEPEGGLANNHCHYIFSQAVGKIFLGHHANKKGDSKLVAARRGNLRLAIHWLRFFSHPTQIFQELHSAGSSAG